MEKQLLVERLKAILTDYDRKIAVIDDWSISEWPGPDELIVKADKYDAADQALKEIQGLIQSCSS